MLRRASYRRLLRALRIAMLLVFTFGLVAQPVLGSLGEMHDLAEHADSAGGCIDHKLPHEHASTTQADEHDSGGPMHQLLHCTHCCGHSAGLASTDLPLPSFHWGATPPATQPAHSVVPAHAATPFRPPISA
jgi:hypothetical protein